MRAVPGDWTAEVASLRSSPSPIVTPRVSARVAWLLLVATLLHVSRYEVMYYGVSVILVCLWKSGKRLEEDKTSRPSVLVLVLSAERVRLADHFAIHWQHEEDNGRPPLKAPVGPL